MGCRVCRRSGRLRHARRVRQPHEPVRRWLGARGSPCLYVLLLDAQCVCSCCLSLRRRDASLACVCTRGCAAYTPQVIGPGPPIQKTRTASGPPGANLFIFHIPNDMTNQDVFQLFAPYGNVISARIMVERETGRSRGFGYVAHVPCARVYERAPLAHGTPPHPARCASRRTAGLQLRVI
ncbi:hypothetical protein EON68_02225 [archaeon]|nr:MAG: hypothetical protein EON68_02225 [archaeon]